MPSFIVTDPNTGQKLKLTGDSPPTEQELEQLFANLPAQESQHAPDQSFIKELGAGLVALGSELSTGIQRSGLGIVDMLGTNTVNAIRQLGIPGIDQDLSPPLASTLVAPAGAFAQGTIAEGLPAQIAGAAGEFAVGGLTGQGLIQQGAKQLAPLAASTGARVLQQAATPSLQSAAGFGAVSGAGSEVGREVGGETGALIGAVAAPFAAAPIQAAAKGIRQAASGTVPDAAGEVIAAGEKAGVKVLTSDVIPPETFAAKSIQQLGEKLGPVLGTGGQRAAQQNARKEVVEQIAQDFGVALDSPLESNIVKNLQKGIAERLSKASTIRNEAVETLDRFGAVNVERTVQSIDEQVSRQVRLRADADPVIIQRLESLKESVQNAEFGLVKDLRSNLIDDISAAFKGEALPTKASAPLQAVKSSIDKDLLSFAKSSDRSAAGKWIRSNRMFADNLRKAKDTELKRLLTKGTETPEAVGTILRGGKISELNRLQRFIGTEGRQAGKAAIIRDALTESGFFVGNVNPDRFVTAIQKPARQRAIGAFFKGSDKKELDGITRLLDATRRAQQASVSTPTGQTLVPVAVTASATQAPVTTFLTAGSLSAVARAYESRFVRNSLLKLSSTPRGSKAESALLSKLLPAVLGSINTLEKQNREK